MSSSDFDSGISSRRSIWGKKPLQGGLYKRTSLAFNLSKPVAFHPIHKKKKRKGARWGESSSDDDYTSGSDSDSKPNERGSGASTPDYGEMEEKKGKAGGDAAAEEGYETPTESAPKSTFFSLSSAFSAAERFVTDSAKKINQLARGKTQEALAADILAAGAAAQPALAAKMSVAQADPFNAQPIAVADDSHDSSSKPPAPSSRPLKDPDLKPSNHLLLIVLK